MTLDFSNPAHYILALLPEVVLAGWAMLVLLVDVFQKGSRSVPSAPGIARLTLVGVLLAAAANAWLMTVQEASPALQAPGPARPRAGSPSPRAVTT